MDLYNTIYTNIYRFIYNCIFAIIAGNNHVIPCDMPARDSRGANLP